MNVTTIPYSSLRPRGDGFSNPRTATGLDISSICELAVLIARHGLLNPLRVSPDYVILAGQRRWHAIAFILEHTLAVATEADVDPDVLARDIRTLMADVPVIIEAVADPQGVAMADNIGRVEMSAYEICAEVYRMHRNGDTGASIAVRIGKSAAYVSKAIRAWRGAGAALHAAWRAGAISFDQVKYLADLPLPDQEAALAEPARRGGHGRPGIEAVKERLVRVTREYAGRAAPKSYAAGVLDALRWVTGAPSSGAFAEFIGPVEE